MGKDNGVKTKAEQMETLSKMVDQNGVGEDPAIKALVSEDFVHMNDEDALAVAIAVAKIVRGQLQEEINGTMSGLKQVMAEMQETARRYEEDRLKFQKDLYNKAESMRFADNDTINRRKIELMEKSQAEAKVATMLKRERIDEMAKTAPTIKMVHPGLPVTVRVNGNKQTIMKPFEIHYEHLVYVLPPNQPVDIPDFIYKAFMSQSEEIRKRDSGLKEALLGGRKHFGEAIKADPVVDPSYSQRLGGVVNSQEFIVREEVSNEE